MPRRRTYTYEAPPEILAEVGGLILWQTELEASLSMFLNQYLRVPHAREFLFANLNNRARVDLIMRLVAAGEPSEDGREAVLFALRCFDICVENRNVLAHSAYEENTPDGHVFQKQPTATTPRAWRFRLTFEDLEAAHRSTERTMIYVVTLWASLKERRRMKRRGGHGPSLPGRFPQPRKLSSFRLP
jgi:hypothetical protein